MKKEELRVMNRLPLLICVSLFFLFHSSFFTPVSAQVRIKPGASSSSQGGLGISPQAISNQNRQQNGHPGNDSIAYSDTSATKGLEFLEDIPDSVLRSKVFFFHYNPRGVKIDELRNPTLDPTGVQFSDPLDGLNGNYYLGKGILGHPHIGLFPSFVKSLRHCLQRDGMEGYVKTPENLRLYQTLTP